MVILQVHFKWTDDKLIIVVKYLQEFKNSLEFRNCNSNAYYMKRSK